MAYEIYILRKDEFERFLRKLDEESKSRLTRDISFLKEHGAELRMPFAKKIYKELWELRIGGNQRVRIIYSIKGTQIYIISWFVKKTMKIPIKELKKAIRRLTDI